MKGSGVIRLLGAFCCSNPAIVLKRLNEARETLEREKLKRVNITDPESRLMRDSPRAIVMEMCPPGCYTDKIADQ